MERQRPDGAVTRFAVSFPGEGEPGSLLPFLIEDRTDRALRVQPSAGVAGTELRGIGWVHLAVGDLNAAARLFRAAFGWDVPAPADSGAAGSGMAHFSGTPVVLSTPARAGLGDSPAGFVLRSHDLRASARRFPRAQRGTWLGRDALWLDPDALGGRYLGISEDATE
jgi:hypothetical protein